MVSRVCRFQQLCPHWLGTHVQGCFYEGMIIDILTQIPEESCRIMGGGVASYGLVSLQLLCIDVVLSVWNIPASWSTLNTWKLSKVPSKPRVAFSNQAKCAYVWNVGKAANHLRKDYKGQPDHVWRPFFPLWFFCIAAHVHLLLIKTQPQQAPPGLFRQPEKKTVRFLLKIALLLTQVPQTSRLSRVYLKIDTSLWRLNPGSTSKRFGFIEIESISADVCSKNPSAGCSQWVYAQHINTNAKMCLMVFIFIPITRIIRLNAGIRGKNCFCLWDWHNLTSPPVFVAPTGSPALSGTGTVTVLVDDVNDNVPVFSSSTFHTTIAEDAPTGTDVLLVNSSDADVGINGAVRYIPVTFLINCSRSHLNVSSTELYFALWMSADKNKHLELESTNSKFLSLPLLDGFSLVDGYSSKAPLFLVTPLIVNAVCSSFPKHNNEDVNCPWQHVPTRGFGLFMEPELLVLSFCF